MDVKEKKYFGGSEDGERKNGGVERTGESEGRVAQNGTEALNGKL